MINLGIVRPGTTIIVPFHTFDSNDPSASVTITGLAVTDIEIYKDGGTTQRASDAGYTLLDTDGIDFDGVTGIHGVSIDLADNTTAGFYAAGSQYTVVIASITVDAATINFIPVVFEIGYPDAVINTTIATLASQTSFTLTDGPAEDNALRDCVVCIHDVASAVQLGFAVVSAYTGSTKTVTLAAGTTFTAAATDNIAIYPPTNVHAWKGVDLNTTNPLPNAAADAAGGLPISDAGGLDMDAMNTAAVRLTAARAQVIDDWLNGGRLDLLLDAIKAVTDLLPDAGALSSLATAAELAKVPKSDGTASWNATALAAINAEVDTALDTAIPGVPTAGSINDVLNDLSARLPGAGTLSVLDAAAVNAEVVDALDTDTYTELGAVPAATSSLSDKLTWLFMLSRNKITQTSAAQAVRNDADAADVATATVSDDGTTFTRGEFT